MKNRFSRLFIKTFGYTMIVFVAILATMFLFFQGQIMELIASAQERQIDAAFEPVLDAMQTKSDEEILVAIDQFHEKNASFEYVFLAPNGTVLYSTGTFSLHAEPIPAVKSRDLAVVGDQSGAGQAAVLAVGDAQSQDQVADGDPAAGGQTTAGNQSAAGDPAVDGASGAEEQSVAVGEATVVGDQPTVWESAAVWNQPTVLSGRAVPAVPGSRWQISGAEFDILPNTLDKQIQFAAITASGSRLIVGGTFEGKEVYDKFLGRLVFMVGILFLVCFVAAVLFSRRIVKPVRAIAADTKKMSELVPVDPPKTRKDEIGDLAQDVHKMYRNLQTVVCRLEAEIKKERQMEESQRYFFSATSHELKTPVAAVGSMLEGMIDGIIEPHEYPVYLEKCLESVHGQNRLIANILEVVSLRQDTIAVDPKEIPLKAFVEEQLAPYRMIAEARKQDVVVDIDERHCCRSDASLLGKAVSNVMANAIQNTAEGDSIRIRTVEKNPSSLSLEFLNEGAAIPEEMMGKLFDAFFRVDAARNRQAGRSGLGLAIVAKTLDLLDIRYSIANTDDGVLFSMRFAPAEKEP